MVAVKTYLSAWMPLLCNYSAYMLMIRHTIDDVINTAISILNPGHILVIAMDQPLYGESNILIMLGGMHIEMAILMMIGVPLKRSGWTAVLVQARVTSLVMADSIPTVAHLNRTRICVCVESRWATHLQGAHAQWAAFGSCYEEMAKRDSQFKFWIIIHLDLTFQLFVRSNGIGEFRLHLKIRSIVALLYFALERVYYVKHLPFTFSKSVP